MRVGAEGGLAKPVEIEFAVRLPLASGEAAEFGFLQDEAAGVVARNGRS